MRVTVYGDFNCPYSYLASQRVDVLLRTGAVDVQWRAVEHDPWLAATGTPTGPDGATWQRELAEVTALALPGEATPAQAPPMVSNTLAAVSAYAEAVTDGLQDPVRRAIFDAIWLGLRHVSSAYDVRAVITPVIYPRFDIRPYLTSGLPLPGYGDPTANHLSRILGGTIAANGIPLTTEGWRRSGSWRQKWLSFGEPVVPTVVDDTGTVRPGIAGLAYLATLVTGGDTALSATTVDGRTGTADGRAGTADNRAGTAGGRAGTAGGRITIGRSRVPTPVRGAKLPA